MLVDINLEKSSRIRRLIGLDDRDLRGKIIELNQKMLNNSTLRDLVRSSRLRSLEPKQETKRRLISKYQGLYLANILLNVYLAHKEDIDNLVEKIFYYALAIENQEYECPKYIRII